MLIASYAQAAILLCIVGQELHDHQSPGLPEQETDSDDIAGRTTASYGNRAFVPRQP